MHFSIGNSYRELTPWDSVIGTKRSLEMGLLTTAIAPLQPFRDSRKIVEIGQFRTLSRQ